MLASVSIDQYAVVIVGAGPAGSAAALRIAGRRPDLADRTLVLDRETFPRDKLCAGGVSSLASANLARIQASPGVKTCRVVAVDLLGSRRELVRPSSGLAFRTVRRMELDSALLHLVRRRGVTVEEGQRVAEIEEGRTGVSVVTDSAEYRALALIGADGASGVVRREIGIGRGERGFALETLVPADPRRDPLATFDFAPIKAGLGGYCWIFPAHDGESPVLNCGIAVCMPDCAHLGRLARTFLVEWLASRGIRCDPTSIRGHGGIAYDPNAILGTRRVCVAGDAAGMEPYLGEGIPCALGTGIEAADAVVTAIDRGDLDLTRYHLRLRRSSIGQLMARRRQRAHALYRRDPVDRYFYAVGLFGRSSRP
jgi:menaquinone-9 beta-reductase